MVNKTILLTLFSIALASSGFAQSVDTESNRFGIGYTEADNEINEKILKLKKKLSDPVTELSAYLELEDLLRAPNTGRYLADAVNAGPESRENARLAILRIVSAQNYVRAEDLSREKAKAKFLEDLPQLVETVPPKYLLPKIYEYAATQDGFLILDIAANHYITMGKLRLAADLYRAAIAILPEKNRVSNGKTIIYVDHVNRIWKRLASLYILMKDRTALQLHTENAKRKQAELPGIYGDLAVDEWTNAIEKMPPTKASWDAYGMEYVAREGDYLYKTIVVGNEEPKNASIDYKLITGKWEMDLESPNIPSEADIRKLFTRDRGERKLGYFFAYLDGSRKYLDLMLAYLDEDRSSFANLAYDLTINTQITEKDLPVLEKALPLLEKGLRLIRYDEANLWKKTAALTLLKSLGEKASRAIPAVTELVESQTPYLRQVSLITLFAISKGREDHLLPVFRKILSDSTGMRSADELVDALRLVAELKTNAAELIPEVASLLGSDGALGEEAARTLRLIGTRQEYLPVFLRNCFRQQEKILEQLKITADEIPFIVPVLHDTFIPSFSSWEQQQNYKASKIVTLKLLMSFGEKSLSALNDIKHAVYDNSCEVQEKALEALSTLKKYTKEKFLAEILTALEMGSYKAKAMLEQTNVNAGDFNDLLLIMLRTESNAQSFITGKATAWKLIKKLGKKYEDTTVERILAQSRHDSWMVREQGIYTLAILVGREKDTVPRLLEVVRNRDRKESDSVQDRVRHLIWHDIANREDLPVEVKRLINTPIDSGTDD